MVCWVILIKVEIAEGLNDKRRGRHYEVDDDGRVHYHLGYTTRICKVCKESFITGIQSNRETCGKRECS